MELKRILSVKKGIPAKMYNLVHENKQILLHKPLQEQNISPESNIQLTLGLKGGSGKNELWKYCNKGSVLNETLNNNNV